MFNIKYRGKFTDPSVLENENLPVDAVKFDEPDTITKVFLNGLYISSPMMIIISLVLFAKHSFVLNVWVLLSSFVLVYVHEYIHALSMPVAVEKEIYTKFDESAMFVFFKQPVSKWQYIWISLSPNLFLAFIPLILVISGVFDFNLTLANSVGTVSWIMMISGIGDYMNIFNAFKQVPKEAKIMNHGFNSYWFL